MPDWHLTNLSEDLATFDPLTSAEGGFVGAGCFLTIAAGCLVIGAVAEQQPLYLLGTLVLGLLAGLAFTLYQKLCDTIELDFRDRQLIQVRKFAGKVRRKRSTSFDQLHRIVVNSRGTRNDERGPLHWFYGLAIVLKNGRLLELTEINQQSFELAQGKARSLSQRMGVEMEPSQPMHRLKVKKGDPPQIILTRPPG